MARKSAPKKEEKKAVNYKEFEFTSEEFMFRGRIYPDSTTSTDKCDITNMSLTLNDVITIKGCKLFQTDKNSWIGWPSYKDKNNEYQSYVFVNKAFSDEVMAKVTAAAEEALGEA